MSVPCCGICLCRWFASVPASTQPNRFYIHSATSHGAMSNNRQDLVDGFPQKTIMDLVDEAGLSFGIYYQNIPATLFFKNMRQLKYMTNFHEYSLSFKLHAKLGLLPNYVIIEQRYFDTKLLPANDDHPAHDVSEGQKFLKEVYETLRSSPQWKNMLLLITYDEHGGFYDHVPTPAVDIPNPDGLIGPEPYFFKFDRLGVRVPTIMVSPWIDKGTGTYILFFFLLNIFTDTSLFFWSITPSATHHFLGIGPLVNATDARLLTCCLSQWFMTLSAPSRPRGMSTRPLQPQ